MNQVPHITIEHASIFLAEDVNEIHALVDLFNRRIDAYNKANEQPEPVEPRSPVVFGTNREQLLSQAVHKVEPTCQVCNLDTFKLKTMTREAAKLLQAENRGACDWFTPLGSQLKSDDDSFGFVSTGIYTYKPKANLVKLDGELMERDVAWRKISLSDKNLFYFWDDSIEWLLSEIKSCGELNNHNFRACEYQLRPKPLKQVSWKDVPVGVMTNKGELRAFSSGLAWCETKKQCPSLAGYTPSQLELATASEQPWLVYIQGETDLSSLKGVKIELLLCVYVKAEQKQIEVTTGYPLTPMQHEHIKAYRITGLAEGYELK